MSKQKKETFENDIEVTLPSKTTKKANYRINNAREFAQVILNVWDKLAKNESETTSTQGYLEQAKEYLKMASGEIEEISTSAGAGGYLSKRTFKKTPKHYRKAFKIKENKGANLGMGPKASNDGVRDNIYVKKFKYKLVNRKKLTKNSKSMDYKDLWGKTYK